MALFLLSQMKTSREMFKDFTKAGKHLKVGFSNQQIISQQGTATVSITIWKKYTY